MKEKIKEKFGVLVDNWKSWVMLSLMITLYATMVGAIADAILYPKVADSVEETTMVKPLRVVSDDETEVEEIASIDEPTRVQPLVVTIDGKPISNEPPVKSWRGLYSTDYTEENGLSYEDYKDAIDELKSASSSIEEPSLVSKSPDFSKINPEAGGDRDDHGPGTYSPLPTPKDIKKNPSDSIF